MRNGRHRHPLHGADPNARSERGGTPLRWTVSQGHTETAALLRARACPSRANGRASSVVRHREVRAPVTEKQSRAVQSRRGMVTL